MRQCVICWTKPGPANTTVIACLLPKRAHVTLSMYIWRRRWHWAKDRPALYSVRRPRRLQLLWSDSQLNKNLVVSPFCGGVGSTPWRTVWSFESGLDLVSLCNTYKAVLLIYYKKKEEEKKIIQQVSNSFQLPFNSQQWQIQPHYERVMMR
jgi:hypothetical protein